MPAQQKNQIEVIKPHLPKSGGDIKGIGETFASHEFSGSASLSIPIPVTPCRGFEPNISLNYSSGSGNGPFGLGFELSLPDISRQTSKCIPRYDDTDTFLYSGDDYLVPVLNLNGTPKKQKSKPIQGVVYDITYFRPRTAGKFDIIECYTNNTDTADVFWLITHSDNTCSLFGKSGNTRITDPNNNKHIYKWLLEERWDTKGNNQLYEYKKEDEKHITPKWQYNNRDTSAQRYLTQINYGNDKPIIGSLLLSGISLLDIEWHFQIVFDYGEQVLPGKTKPASPGWLCRQDPFSDYRPGFELRTYRLCQNILLFHQFPYSEYQNSQPVLTTAIELHYKASPQFSLLTGVTHTGFTYTKSANPQYTSKSLPPVDLGYVLFTPNQSGYIPHYFETASTVNGNDLIGLANKPYQLVDLYGEGIPGVLLTDGISAGYHPPNQVSNTGVIYETMESMSFPPGNTAQDTFHVLNDVTGNGQLDLVASVPNEAGYYETEGVGAWSTKRAFSYFPSDYHSDDYYQVDVTGDGLADLVQISDKDIVVYKAKRYQGYEPRIVIPCTEKLPVAKAGSKQETIRFADMCGIGLPQLVRIQNGVVECWPNLGYGKFGQKITLENAPDFGPDFDVSRLRVTDVDGSGISDLAYISASHVDIYLNQSGNSFAQTPITIPLPQNWDTLDQIQFSDIKGNGNECLVFTTSIPKPKQWIYDFNLNTIKTQDGHSEQLSQKPYLLNQIVNNMGAETTFRYTSSTKFYLEDQNKGLEWVTKLPFPVQVVESVCHTDHITGTNAHSKYKYHHGFYDGFEREFRGFGRVDRTDSSSFKNFSPDITGFSEDDYKAPPLVTKTWYHTGAWLKEQDLLEVYQKEFWSGDPHPWTPSPTNFVFLTANQLLNELDACGIVKNGKVVQVPTLKQLSALLDIVFHPYFSRISKWHKGNSITASSLASDLKIPLQVDTITQQEAYRTLHGSVLRTEVYGNDHTPWTQIPYSVSEANFTIREMQLQAKNKYAVFMLQSPESIHFDYERNANDPKVNHNFTLQIDQYGHVLQSVQVAYGRRLLTHLNIAPQTATQQKQTNITYSQSILKNQVSLNSSGDSDYLLGIPLQMKHYEVTGLTLRADKFYFVPEDFKNGALDNKTLLSWQREYYFNATNGTELALGNVTKPLLHHRTEFIEFEIAKLQAEYYGVLDDKALAKKIKHGGYIVKIPKSDPDHLAAQNYYWNPGSAQSYFGSAKFYLPQAFFDPFQYPYIKNGAISTGGVAQTSYTYDDYNLLVNTVTDPLNNITRISQIDYQHLAPVEVEDINGNRSGVLLDPLGMVILTGTLGSDYKGDVGFAMPTTYKQVNKPTLKDIIINPDKYLQHCASYFYYDLDTWSNSKTPIVMAELVAEEFTFNGTAPIPLKPQATKTVTYFDGFGRPLQSKAYLNSQETVRYWDKTTHKVSTKTANTCWLTSGAVIYDNKGQVVKKFEPFFSPDYNYINEPTLNKVGYSNTLYYDSLGRNVLNVSPEGFITKTLFGTWDKGTKGNYTCAFSKTLYAGLPGEFIPSAWDSLHFDANDTIKDSDYYKNHLATSKKDVDGPSLKEALPCYNTPTVTYTNALGYKLQTEQFNVQDNEKNVRYNQVDILGDLLSSEDGRQYKNLCVTASYFMRIKLTGTESSTLFKDLQNPPGGIIKPILDSNGNLIAANFKPGNSSYLNSFSKFLTKLGTTFLNKQALILASLEQIGHNFVSDYSLSKQAVRSISADGGVGWSLKNVVGNPYYSQKGDGTISTTTFDKLHRLVSEHIANPNFGLNQIVQYHVYGDSRTEIGLPYFLNAKANNQLGQAIISFDQSGLSLSPFYNIHAQAQAAGKILTKDYTQEVNWNSIAQQIPVVLGVMDSIATPDDLHNLNVAKLKVNSIENVIYASSIQYDALSRVKQSTDPDGNVTTPTYYSTGWVRSESTVAGPTATTVYNKPGTPPAPGISCINYNAKGQRTKILYCNNVVVKYGYDPQNFRLTSIYSSANCGNKKLQDLEYHHDPVGNVTSLKNNLTPVVLYDNQQVKPESTYKYDTLYRLVSANGREHKQMWQNLQQHNNKINVPNLPTNVNPISNGAALQNYTIAYEYDKSDNLTTITHTVSGTNVIRSMTIDKHSNRLLSSKFGNKGMDMFYIYDLHGNQQNLNQVKQVNWNYRNNIRSVSLYTPTAGKADMEYYVYDSSGNRSRKVRVTRSGVTTQIQEVIYLGDFEIRRKGKFTGTAPIKYTEVWHWVHQADCRWCYLTAGSSKATNYQLRYQLTNSLNSSCMELNEKAQLISYEEYYPYGGTSIITAKGKLEVNQRYYRYSGKEADDSTGLYYYGMRYYCPWLARWTCPDPAGTIDGLNIFAFVNGNPITHVDVGGMVKKKKPLTLVEKKEKARIRKKDPNFSMTKKRPNKIGWSHTAEISAPSVRVDVPINPNMSKERLLVRHLSTSLLMEDPASIVEVQVAIDTKGKKLYIASNSNSKAVASQLPKSKKLSDLKTRDWDVNGSGRVNRHLYKLEQELKSNDFKDFEIVHIATAQGGTHAEVKLHRHLEANNLHFDYIGGTRRPCACCKAYFKLAGVDPNKTDKHSGAHWNSITAGLSLADYSDEEIKKVDDEVNTFYANKGLSDKESIDHGTDSEDDDDFHENLRKQNPIASNGKRRRVTKGT